MTTMSDLIAKFDDVPSIANAELDHTQILALASTPQQIIAATETLAYVGSPTMLPIPFAAFAVLKRGAHYTNVDVAANLLLVWGSDQSVNACSADRGNGSATPSPFFAGGSGQPDSAVAVFGAAQFDNGFNLAGDFNDNGLYLALANGGSGDIAGGDAGDTLQVTVFYRNLTFV